MWKDWWKQALATSYFYTSFVPRGNTIWLRFTIKLTATSWGSSLVLWKFMFFLLVWLTQIQNNFFFYFIWLLHCSVLTLQWQQMNAEDIFLNVFLCVTVIYEKDSKAQPR